MRSPVTKPRLALALAAVAAVATAAAAAGLDNTCWVSLSGSDAVAVLDTETGQELAFDDVGNHRQRVRHDYVSDALAATW